MNMLREMTDTRHDRIGLYPYRVGDHMLDKPDRLLVGVYCVSDSGAQTSARYQVEARQSPDNDWSAVIHAGQSADGGSALAVIPYVPEVRLRIFGVGVGCAVHLVLAPAASRRWG